MSNESFDDNTVIEPADIPTAEDIAANPSEDTFDNGVYPEESKGKDSQVQLLDEEDGDDKSREDEKGGEKEKPEVDRSEKKEDEGEEKKESEGEKTEKPQGKTLRIKDGENSVDISADATVKVKVKGKNEFVSIEELKSNYSGQKAWTEEIATAKEKTELAEQNTEKFQSERNEVIGHLEKVAGMLDQAEGDPLEALYYLLDITGRDVNTYTKRVFDFMEQRVDDMSEMDDVEKELYWNKRKLQSIEDNQAAKADTLQQENTQRDFIARVDQIRESQGVSEDQYVAAHNELVGLGLDANSIRPEQVVEYSVLKPFAEKAEAISYEYRDDLGDDELDALTTELTSVMQKRPGISDEDALSVAAKMLGYDVESAEEHIDILNDKIPDQTQYKQTTKVSEGGAVESFDDFDY